MTSNRLAMLAATLVVLSHLPIATTRTAPALRHSPNSKSHENGGIGHLMSERAREVSDLMVQHEEEVANAAKVMASFQEPLPLHHTSLKETQAVKRMGLHAPFHISHAFYINLESRPDRKRQIERNLDTFFSGPRTRVAGVVLNASRTRGAKSIWPPQRNAEEEEITERFLRHHPMSPWLASNPSRVVGFVGSVFASHIREYYNLLETYPHHDPDTLFIVMEDDTSLVKDWETLFSRYYASVPNDWDIIRLDTWGNYREEDMIRPHVYAAKGPFKEGADIFYAGMHAVILRPRTLPRLIRHLNTEPLTDIDEMVTSCCDGIKSYVLSLSSMSLDVGPGGSDHPAASS